MSESYMKKGLEAQKPTEVMAEGLRFYANEFLRWGIGKPAEDTPLILAAVTTLGMDCHIDVAGPEHAQNVRCALPEFLGYWDTECEEKIKNAPAETRTPSGRRPMRGRLSSTPLL